MMPDPDRADLPVWLGLFDSPADRRAADVLQLARDGLLDPASAPLDVLEHLVDDLGLGGAHEAAVRASGVLYRCPPWCEADDHARVGIHDHDLPPAHWTARTEVAGVRVDVGADTGTPVVRLLAHREPDLTASDARRLAAALLNAADALDGIDL